MEKIDGISIKRNALSGTESAERAFEELYRYFYRRLVVYASTFRAIPVYEREDLSHEIIIHSFSKLHRYDSGRSLSSWVYGVARNYLVDTIRSRKFIHVPANDHTLAENENPESRFEVKLEQTELLAGIMGAIQAMGELDRRIAMLVFYEELTPGEAARALAIPSGTLRWRLMNIRKRLRKIRGEEL